MLFFRNLFPFSNIRLIVKVIKLWKKINFVYHTLTIIKFVTLKAFDDNEKMLATSKVNRGIDKTCLIVIVSTEVSENFIFKLGLFFDIYMMSLIWKTFQ